MFLPGDFTSEVIAHFIGYFRIDTEEARLRLEYTEFRHSEEAPAGEQSQEAGSYHFSTQFHAEPSAVDIRYAPSSQEIEHVAARSSVHFNSITGHVPVLHEHHTQPHFAHHGGHGGEQLDYQQPAPPVPGSTVLVAEQIHRLSDDDHISTGSDAPHVAADPMAMANVEALSADALAISAPLGPDGPIASPSAAVDFIAGIRAFGQAVVEAEGAHHGQGDGAAAPPGLDPASSIPLADMATGMASAPPAETQDASAPAAPVMVHTVEIETVSQGLDASSHADDIVQIRTTDIVVAPVFEGIHVNGGETTAPPVLADSLPAVLRPEVVSSAPPNDATSGASSSAVTVHDPHEAPTMAVNAGGNLMVNEGSLVNAGVQASFIGVAGDYHRLDAIIQTNAYSDDGHVDAGFPGANGVGQAAIDNATQAVNLASFTHETNDATAVNSAANPGGFPDSWHVSVVQGDMMFVDWIAQYGFTSDNDTNVLTATGTHTTITSGENIGINHVGFADLGHFFDLMLVGGNLYDGNVISQTNVLFDNDSLTNLSPMTGATGTVLTSDNLLWNQASIVNFGADNWQQGLPGSYLDAISTLDSGDTTMPGSLGSESWFEGLSSLRVLYVAGSVYDLHSITQVNVLGDSDQVALYRDNLLANSPETVWDVSTGSNALINAASIVDYDTVGDTAHYGGTMYSDAILIQADIVQGTQMAQLPNADALASEVVAFLGDELDAHLPSADDVAPAALHIDIDVPSSLDVMHAVLA